MNIFRIKTLTLTVLILLCVETVTSQELTGLRFAKANGITAESIIAADSIVMPFSKNRPLFSFLFNNIKFTSSDAGAVVTGKTYTQIFKNQLHVTFGYENSAKAGIEGTIIFENRGSDTIEISNVVPFGEDAGSVFITGKGPDDLVRAWLFRPGLREVRVILPDNAWELGYSSFNLRNDTSVCSLTRRHKSEGGIVRRYETALPPEAKVTYSFHSDFYKGEWQNGLRLMFRDRYIYDIENFNNSLYEREDLAWIKKCYLIILQMAWDREYYDRFTGKFTYPDFLKNSIDLFGKIDVFGIWPTWPRLGLDQRNQWEMYRDLPGGTSQLRSFNRMSRQEGTKVFIAYNPWDDNPGNDTHLQGMAQVIAETEADGVILDTRGNSGPEIQNAADSVRKGIIMYSEGMAIPSDMPGIISGRVHNAIYLSPELNLNKLIKPDFSIFRVCDIGEAPIHRETAIAFFNGYGTELNMFRPGGRDEKYREDLDFLSATTFILRQNNDAFLDREWTPLIETTLDNVYVNRWKSGDKTIFTVLNMRHEGINGKLFEVEKHAGKHYVSLWNHENLQAAAEYGHPYIHSNCEAWPLDFSGTRLEGSVECIAEFPVLIKSILKGDSLNISKTETGKLIIWKGNPSYKTLFKEFSFKNDTTLSIKDLFGYYEGKIVLQLVENDLLKDESIHLLQGGKPWLISKVSGTIPANGLPDDMVLVPGTTFNFNVTSDEKFIPYPEVSDITFKLDSFLIDRYPVTNAQYYDFMLKSRYWPADTSGFLRHWHAGTFRQGQDKYPVVYVSYEDIMAYVKWSHKRLPTEAEWQLAAQGQDKRIWPWGNEFHGTFCNNSFNRPTPVDAFSRGGSPYGAMDMVGNVWQMTNDTYFNGSNYFVVIRGGSYYKPGSSYWYLKGGPQSLDKTQILLMVSPGFDRSPTVGFRCVKDIDSRTFNYKK